MNLKIFVVLFLWCFSSTIACQTRIKSPVLELRPLPEDRRSTLIWVKSSDTSQHWIGDINSFLKPYFDRTYLDNLVSCSHDLPPPKDKVCEMEVRHKFGPCVAEHNYGYNMKAPCIFLSFSQIPKGWSPINYNSTSMPVEMPEYLKMSMRDSELRKTHQKVWVSCEGENAADKENIGPISYFPELGFPAHSFLNNYVIGYLSPVVAVQFEKPPYGLLIMVRCTAWAKNIPRDPEDKIGTVHFELLVE